MAADEEEDVPRQIVRDPAREDAMTRYMQNAGGRRSGLFGLKGLVMSAAMTNQAMDKKQVSQAQKKLDSTEGSDRKASLIHSAFTIPPAERSPPRASFQRREDSPAAVVPATASAAEVAAAVAAIAETREAQQYRPSIRQQQQQQELSPSPESPPQLEEQEEGKERDKARAPLGPPSSLQRSDKTRPPPPRGEARRLWPQDRRQSRRQGQQQRNQTCENEGRPRESDELLDETWTYQRCNCHCGCRASFDGASSRCPDCRENGPRHRMLLQQDGVFGSMRKVDSTAPLQVSVSEDSERSPHTRSKSRSKSRSRRRSRKARKAWKARSRSRSPRSRRRSRRHSGRRLRRRSGRRSGGEGRESKHRSRHSKPRVKHSTRSKHSKHSKKTKQSRRQSRSRSRSQRGNRRRSSASSSASSGSVLSGSFEKSSSPSVKPTKRKTSKPQRAPSPKRKRGAKKKPTKEERKRRTSTAKREKPNVKPKKNAKKKKPLVQAKRKKAKIAKPKAKAGPGKKMKKAIETVLNKRKQAQLANVSKTVKRARSTQPIENAKAATKPVAKVKKDVGRISKKETVKQVQLRGPRAQVARQAAMPDLELRKTTRQGAASKGATTATTPQPQSARGQPPTLSQPPPTYLHEISDSEDRDMRAGGSEVYEYEEYEEYEYEEYEEVEEEVILLDSHSRSAASPSEPAIMVATAPPPAPPAPAPPHLDPKVSLIPRAQAPAEVRQPANPKPRVQLRPRERGGSVACQGQGQGQGVVTGAKVRLLPAKQVRAIE